MDNADHLLAQSYDVDIGSGQGIAKLFQRLIGERYGINQTMVADESFDTFLGDSAADKEKTHIIVIAEMASGLKEGVQGVGGAVVAAVHENELARQAMDTTEGVGSGIYAADRLLVRPGRHDQHFAVKLARITTTAQTIGHEAVQSDDQAGAAENEAIDAFQKPGRRAGGR